MSATRTAPNTRGVLFVHSTPAALCPHVQWALESVLGQRVRLEWTAQPVLPGSLRTELTWSGPAGTGARLASALRGWDHVRYEVTEDPAPGSDGSRWTYTPELGIHHTWMSASGETVVNEDRLRTALRASNGDPHLFAFEMEALLGSDWDAELEPFRYAGDGAPAQWLHRVG